MTTATTSNVTNEQFVRALYLTVFNKANPDAEGLAWWLNDLNNGATFEQVAGNFMQHSEYIAAHPNLNPNNTVEGFIADNTSMINQAWSNTYNTSTPIDILNHTNIIMLSAVPEAAILVMIADSSIVGVNHETWWGF